MVLAAFEHDYVQCIVDASAMETIELCAFQIDARKLLPVALSDFTARERRIILARINDIPYSTIAKFEGVTVERTRQIYMRLLRMLRHHSRSAKLKPLYEECR